MECALTMRSPCGMRDRDRSFLAYLNWSVEICYLYGPTHYDDPWSVGCRVGLNIGRDTASSCFGAISSIQTYFWLWFDPQTKDRVSNLKIVLTHRQPQTFQILNEIKRNYKWCFRFSYPPIRFNPINPTQPLNGAACISMLRHCNI